MRKQDSVRAVGLLAGIHGLPQLGQGPRRMIATGNANNAQLRCFERNRRGRDFAVGDIHGCFTALQAALDSIGFSTAVDRLFCAGDLVDRGPESEQVSSWLDKPWFFSTKGNHDLMAYRYALNDPQALSSVLNHGGAWLLDLPKDELRRIGHRLRALPLAIEVETSGGPIGLVHAGFPGDDWRAIDTPFSEDDVGISLWSTMRFDRVYAAKVLNVRSLIHGHLTVSSAQQIANVFFIDTGGWMLGRGHFTFVELESLKLIRGPGGDASFGSQRNR